MKRLLSFLLTILVPLLALATEAELDTLDAYVGRRAQYMAAKQKRIDHIKALLQSAPTADEQLQLCDRMFEEYYTFSFDSAMVYVRRGLEMARKAGNRQYEDNFLIHRGLLLATGGYYSQAEAVLQSIDPQKLHPSLLFKYHYSVAWLYNFWCAYCNDSEFSPTMAQKRAEHIALAIGYTPKGGAMYNYLMGESLFYQGKNDESMKYYARAVRQVPVSDRIYASATYALARGYKQKKQMAKYETWIIRAGISDQVCPLKENLALQEFSLYLYELSPKNSARAVRYIYCSMEDAQFYNNRLRMIEISRILPRIVATYQTQINEQTTRARWALGGVSLLAALLLFFIVFSLRQNKKLNQRRLRLRAQNNMLETLNAQLNASNQQLHTTNVHRETYLRLFLDMTALYIGKLEGMRKQVTRSLKAGQTAELLQKMSKLTMKEEETRTFNDRFDRAFLLLYPDFVENLNALLRPEERITPPTDYSLTAELRIYALMRLGITGTQEIATLLFHSTRTIYNQKSIMRSRAICRDTFDEDINALCHILPGKEVDG